jgi:hypothetical protein
VAGTESPQRIVERFGDLADAGAQHIIVGMPNVTNPDALDLVGRDVIPALRPL